MRWLRRRAPGRLPPAGGRPRALPWGEPPPCALLLVQYAAERRQHARGGGKACGRGWVSAAPQRDRSSNDVRRTNGGAEAGDEDSFRWEVQRLHSVQGPTGRCAAAVRHMHARVRHTAAPPKTALPWTLTSARMRRQGVKATGLASRWTTRWATMTVLSAGKNISPLTTCVLRLHICDSASPIMPDTRRRVRRGKGSSCVKMLGA